MIKNVYVKCAVVLGCICVVSAGLIGGLNALATSYKASHKSTDTPDSIKALKDGATFVEVTELPQAVTSNSTKVTFESIYALQEGGKTTGYAYIVNCSKVKSTDIEFSVLYEGAATEATKTTVKPSAINVIAGGDSGFDTNVFTLAETIPTGSATMNDYTNVVSGGTWSQKFFIDGLQVTRDDYVARINGGSVAPVVEQTPVQKIYGDKYESDEEDTSFVALTGSTDHCVSYEITNRYTVKLTDGTTSVAYGGKVSYLDPEEETDVVKLTAGFSGSGDDIKLDGYKVTQNVSYRQYASWLDAVKDGTTTLDDDGMVETGGTMTLNAVRDLVRAMRDAYKGVNE